MLAWWSLVGVQYTNCYETQLSTIKYDLLKLPCWQTIFDGFLLIGWKCVFSFVDASEIPYDPSMTYDEEKYKCYDSDKDPAYDPGMSNFQFQSALFHV